MNYFKVLLKLTKKAYKKNEVPIAALIVYNNKVISKSYNKRHNHHDVLGHAEILAIKKASKKLRTWHLTGCDLYVTMEPCSMCKSVINETKIDNVYYFLKYNKIKQFKTKYKYVDIKNNYIFKEKIQSFFKNKR